jgi:monooxygenase
MDAITPLLPEGTDIDKHFTPRYRPWQQRIAIVPDGDLFEAMRDGRASIVTDTITEFTEEGVRVSSGEVLEADVVVTATGFDLSVFGDIPFTVDGEPVDFSRRVTWHGMMISGVPNMAYAFGYFRHSWTLRVDLVNDVVARIVERMAERGARTVVPELRPQDADMELREWSDPENFNPNYVLRSQERMFKQGDREPWTHMQEYAHDRTALPEADVDDGLSYR